jgi:hypothetical protein
VDFLDKEVLLVLTLSRAEAAEVLKKIIKFKQELLVLQVAVPLLVLEELVYLVLEVMEELDLVVMLLAEEEALAPLAEMQLLRHLEQQAQVAQELQTQLPVHP